MSRNLPILATFVLIGALFTSCAEEHQQTARQVLQTFCGLHRAEILNTLLTEEQRAAATTVCAAIGLRLGTGDT